MRITLIGFMGSGKTTAGESLAAKLGYTFVDLDQAVEAVERKTITTIFEESGEEHFRKTEHEMLKALLEKDNCVIATGGGTPCFNDNMLLINQKSISVYLKLSADSLFDRLVNEREHRPLIKTLNEKELKQFILDKLLLREPYYLKAHYKVKSKEIQIGALAEFILKESGITVEAQTR